MMQATAPKHPRHDAAFKIGEEAFRTGCPREAARFPELAALIKAGADSYSVYLSFTAGWVFAGSKAEASDLPLSGYRPEDSISAGFGDELDLDFSIVLMPMNPADARTGETAGVILFLAPGKSWGDSHLRKHGEKYIAHARASLACAQYRDATPRAVSMKYRGTKALATLARELALFRYSEAAIARFVAAAKPFCPPQKTA